MKPWIKGGIIGLVVWIGLYLLIIFLKLIITQFNKNFDPDLLWSILFFLSIPPFPIITSVIVSLFLNIKNKRWINLELRYKFGLYSMIAIFIVSLLSFGLKIKIFMIIIQPILFLSGLFLLEGFADSYRATNPLYAYLITVIPITICLLILFYLMGYILGYLFEKLLGKNKI